MNSVTARRKIRAAIGLIPSRFSLSFYPDHINFNLDWVYVQPGTRVATCHWYKLYKKSCRFNVVQFELQYMSLLTKRTRKSTQVCKTRTCVRTCDGWPNGFASRLASSRKSHKPYISHIYSWLAINLCRLALGGQNGKNLRRLAYEFELAKVNATLSATQVGGQTKRKLNTSRKLVLTCVDLRVRLTTEI